MKITFIIILFLLCSIISFGQDTIYHTKINSKQHFSIKTGFHYKTFIGKKYIESKEYSDGEKFRDHQYDRFTKKTSFGFNLGVIYNRNNSQHWNLNLGLIYCLRKDIYSNNIDTVLKYNTNEKISNIIKYNYTYHNVELPILINYNHNKINLYAGANIAILCYRNAKYSYANDFYPKITLNEFEMPFSIYPTFQFCYDLKVKNISFKPFIGLDIYNISFNEFYFHIWSRPLSIEMRGVYTNNSFFIHGGIIIPILKNTSK